MLVLAGCGGGGSGSHAWRDLRRVSVTLANGSLPPPFGLPKTTVYSTPTALARVTAKLNGYRIAAGTQSSNDGGCTGGYEVTISILQTASRRARLSGYRCADSTYGIRGDLPGFLASLGLSAP